MSGSHNRQRRTNYRPSTMPNLPDNSGIQDNSSEYVPIFKREKVVITLITGVSAVIASIFTALADIEAKKMEIEQEKWLHDQENAYVQEFINTPSTEEVFNIEYINYSISTSPDLPGFQVIPYSYIKYISEADTTFLFLNNQFSQSQYCSDENGICSLKRENSSEALIQILEKELGAKYPNKKISISSGCAICVKYTVARSPVVSFFELTNGSLPTLSNEDLLTAISEYNADKKGIDMIAFPQNKEKILTEFF